MKHIELHPIERIESGAAAAARTESARINGREVRFAPGETVLEVARRAGIPVPTLCEFAALAHRPGTCRMCLVEIKAPGEAAYSLATACDTRMTPGLEVETRSKRVREARKLQASLLFADHCETCSACARHGQCELQDVARTVGLDLGRLSGRYVSRTAEKDKTAALVFTPDKCIRCLRCVEVCRQVHGIGAITFEGIGTGAAVGFDGRPWAESDRCIQCGQCTLVCPTGALDVRDEVDRALDMLADPEIVTIFQLAPATRVTLPEVLGLAPGENFEGRMVAALKGLGADFVMDTRWSADVTILEEGTELIERLERQKAAGTLATHPDTMFTSCCPGWINHAEKSAPDILEHVSSTRSPQAIFSALAKTWLPQSLGIDPDDVKEAAVDWLKRDPQYAYVVDLEHVNEATLPAVVRERITNGYHRMRSGDIQIVLNPANYEVSSREIDGGTTHGVWNPYDSHIPFIIMGWHVKPGTTDAKTTINDIAATVCALIHIQMPNGCIGNAVETE